MQPSSTGLIPGLPPENTRLSGELFSSASPVPFEYFPDKASASKYIDAFPLENQVATNSCVAHDRALNLAIYRTVMLGEAYVQPSPAFIYFYRSNTPSPGMILSDANLITENQGVPSYADYPTPHNDATIDGTPPTPAVISEAKMNRVKAWLTASVSDDIDVIAGAVNGVGVAAGLLIYATIEEWSMETPLILVPSLAPEAALVRHCITVLPKSAFRDTDGKRYVIIQESAFFGGFHFRYLSEDFIKARCVGIDYIATLENSTNEKRTSYTFNADLSIGSVGPDVTALQTALQELGFFPTLLNGRPFTPTGNYYGLTKQAVLDFQNAYADEILKPAGLSAGTGYFGPSSRAQMNKLLNP